MTETLRNRNRSRSWSDFSDIVDEELDTPVCRVMQGLVASVMICVLIYFVLKYLSLYF